MSNIYLYLYRIYTSMCLHPKLGDVVLSASLIRTLTVGQSILFKLLFLNHNYWHPHSYSTTSCARRGFLFIEISYFLTAIYLDQHLTTPRWSGGELKESKSCKQQFPCKKKTRLLNPSTLTILLNLFLIWTRSNSSEFWMDLKGKFRIEHFAAGWTYLKVNDIDIQFLHIPSLPHPGTIQCCVKSLYPTCPSLCAEKGK